MKSILAVAMLAACCAAQAQVTPPEVAAHQRQELRHGDPARWSHPDRSTSAQMATLRKEINAALAEARTACKQMDRGDRADCMKEAQANYTADLHNMRQQIADARNLELSNYDTSGR
jgi:hypothetical protein